MKRLKSLIGGIFVALLFALASSVQAEDSAAFTQAELDQMLAPIALYPDTVLSHVLIAATYPLEVVEAARWSRTYPDLRGEEAVAAVEDRPWDASVKALVAFPDLIRRMDEDLAWTRNLGEAFLVQEGDVVDSVQYLRNQAYEEGNLASNEQVEVVRETRYIYIEPREPRRVYVPYYDPWVVYGSWRWAAYPPVYWPRPPGISVGISFHWGSGFHIQPSFFFSAFHWPHRQVVVVNHHHHHRGYFHRPHRAFRSPPRHAGEHGPKRWRHDPRHRHGVKYRHAVADERFDRPGQAARKGTTSQRRLPGHDRNADPKIVASRFSGRRDRFRSVERRSDVSRSVRSRTPSAKGRKAQHRTQPVHRSEAKVGQRRPPSGASRSGVVRERNPRALGSEATGRSHRGVVSRTTRPDRVRPQARQTPKAAPQTRPRAETGNWKKPVQRTQPRAVQKSRTRSAQRSQPRAAQHPQSRPTPKSQGRPSMGRPSAGTKRVRPGASAKASQRSGSTRSPRAAKSARPEPRR